MRTPCSCAGTFQSRQLVLRGNPFFLEVGHADVWARGCGCRHARLAVAHLRYDLPDPVNSWTTTLCCLVTNEQVRDFARLQTPALEGRAAGGG